MFVLGLLLALPATARAAGSGDGQRLHFDIARQSADQALIVFAEQADLTLIVPFEDVRNTMTNRLAGIYPPEEAIAILLLGTGLEATFVSRSVLRVSVVERISSEGDGMEDAGRLSFGKRVMAALASIFVAGGASAQPGAGQEAGGASRLEEVIVTATKRETTLQDTAASISVLSAQDLIERAPVGMEDYLNSVPGVNFLDRGVGNNQIIIRGIGLGFAERSTVGSYFGEAPLSNPIIATSTDMKLVDMERIEVLRGPQGTLFGGGTMSGAVRNIPKAPNLSQAEGRVTVEYSNTDGADGSNGNVTAVMNLPLVSDELALRLVGYRFDEAGYVDLVDDPAMRTRGEEVGAPIAVKEGVGGHDYTGVRGTLAWQPTDRFDLSLMVAYQELEETGRNDVNISRGEYEATALDTGREFKEDELSLLNLVMNYDLGWGVVTSSTSRIDGDTADSSDLGRVIPWAAVGFSDLNKKGTVQELRIASTLDGPLQFTAGVYYEDFESYEECCWRWTGDQSKNPFGDPNLRTVITDAQIEQKAVFGEVSYDVTDMIKLTAGGRWFDYERDDDIRESGPLAAGDTLLSTSENDTRWKAGIDVTPSDDALIYALWSQGFRLGQGVTVPSPDVCDTDGDGNLDFTDIPLGTSSLKSDTTNNLELGGKFEFLDDRVVVNAAIYRIDWDDIPVGALGDNPVCSATINGGKARSQGVELEASMLLTDNLRFFLSGSYIDAEFRNDLAGSEGERLPMSPEFNGNIGIEYDFNIRGNDSFVRADLTYVGDFTTSGSIPTESGDYTTLNLNAGVTLGNFDLMLIGSNLTNEDDVTVAFFLDRGWRLRPRTIGLQLGYRF